MGRLTSKVTGVVVNVDDETASALGPEWVAESEASEAPVDETAEPQSDGDPVEPKGNGTREAWAAWADHLGVEYSEDDKREDIKAAIEAAATSDDSGDGTGENW
jgi:hypothetical protein